MVVNKALHLNVESDSDDNEGEYFIYYIIKIKILSL